MLKTIVSPEKFNPERLEVGDGEVEGFDIGSSMKYAKKSEKMSKSLNLVKSGKKLSKSGNSTNFDITEAGPRFLIPDAKTSFNRLRLAFTEAPILWHFHLKCHIQIKTDALGYAMGGVLSQLISRTSPNKVVIKTNLSQ